MALCLAGGWLALRRGPAMAFYQGRPLLTWAVQFYSPSQKERDEATAVFKALGAKAVPGLDEMLRIEDSSFRKQRWLLAMKLPSRWRRQVVTRLGPPDAATIQAAAAKALAVLGPSARPAIPSLIRALHSKSGDVCLAATIALSQIGKEAVPELLTALSSTNAAVRHAAAVALGQLGPEAEPAMPVLFERLADPDPTVRQAAAYAVSKTGIPSLTALLDVLESGDTNGTKVAASMLPRLYLTLRRAVPSLMKLAQDRDPAVRRQALETLGGLRAADGPAFSTVVAALKDPDAEVRLAALKALSQSSWKAPPAVPELTACLHDVSPQVRAGAARLLGTLGPAAKTALSDLSQLSTDPEASVRAAAAEALGRITAP